MALAVLSFAQAFARLVEQEKPSIIPIMSPPLQLRCLLRHAAVRQKLLLAQSPTSSPLHLQAVRTMAGKTSPEDWPVKLQIGKREVVGFGSNGEEVYFDDVHYPFPAIRFKEDTGEIAVSTLRNHLTVAQCLLGDECYLPVAPARKREERLEEAHRRGEEDSVSRLLLSDAGGDGGAHRRLERNHRNSPPPCLRWGVDIHLDEAIW